MESKEAIIQATIELIEQRGQAVHDITVREICKKANVGLGLVNYHFGNKDKLIECCVERIVNGIVSQFQSIQESVKGLTPFETLDELGSMTWNFLFDHAAISKISILTDMKSPKEDDNTHRTYRAFLPLVSACRPDWNKEMVAYKTFCLIATMQQTFLRSQVIGQRQGIDLTNATERKAIHTRMLQDLLEVPRE